MADIDELLKKHGGVVVSPEGGDVAATAAKYGGRDVVEENLPLPRRKYSAGEALMEAPFNVPKSGSEFLGGLAEMVKNPVTTLSNVFDAAAGAIGYAVPDNVREFMNQFDADPAARERAMRTAKAVGGVYADRYGDWDSIKRTVAEDPVGAIGDLSMIFSGGAGTARVSSRIAPTAKLAEGLQTAARYTDPLSVVAPAANVTGKAIGGMTNYLARVSNPKAAALLDAAEGRGPEIVNALRNYDQWVAGGQPTAGVAAAPVGSAKYAALQSEVANQLPSEYLAREGQNVAARAKALGEIAQDKAALKSAEQTRAAVSEPLYKAAEQGVADVSGVKAKLDTLIAENPGNRELVRELSQIRNDLIVDKKTGALRTNAKEITSVIDGIKTRLAKEDTKFIKGNLKDIREALVDAVPGYRAAQEKFAEASKPINVMQVGQYLEGKLSPAIPTPTGERSGVFSAAIKEAPTTLKRSTGQSRFSELNQILEPDQVKVVEGIRKDLARQAEFEVQASKGKKAGGAIPAAELAKSPAFFSKIATLANTIVDKLQGKIDKKVALELATEMLDPKLAADALEKALARQARGEALADPFKRGGTGTQRMLRGESGVGLRSPFTLSGVQIQNALAPENRNNLRAP